MKKMFVQLLRALVCAGSIAAAAAASPSITLAVFVNSGGTWIDAGYTPQNGGELIQGSFFGVNKLVYRGTFSTVFASQSGGSSVIHAYEDTDPPTYYGTYPVSGLSYAGTSVDNVFILEYNTGTASFTFRTMNGGLSGVVSYLSAWPENDKILFVGDFGTGSTSYADFRIWDIGNVAWDTYTMRLSGYDGYWPSAIQQISPDTFKVRLSLVADAYGGYTDNDGWESFPWTTDWVYWDISLQRWTGYE